MPTRRELQSSSSQPQFAPRKPKIELFPPQPPQPMPATRLGQDAVLAQQIRSSLPAGRWGGTRGGFGEYPEGWPVPRRLSPQSKMSPRGWRRTGDRLGAPCSIPVYLCCLLGGGFVSLFAGTRGSWGHPRRGDARGIAGLLLGLLRAPPFHGAPPFGTESSRGGRLMNNRLGWEETESLPGP